MRLHLLLPTLALSLAAFSPTSTAQVRVIREKQDKSVAASVRVPP